jgi:hypothetical protein
VALRIPRTEQRLPGPERAGDGVVRRLLAREVLVHGELVNVRWAGSTDRGYRGSDAFCREAVEVLARLPEVEHAQPPSTGPDA